MASSIQFSGLASGLDTASIIEQLMTVEALPQKALKTKLATEQAKQSALQSLNSAFQGLATSAHSFDSGSTWNTLTSTSSNSAFTVTASSKATPTNLSLKLIQTASVGKLSYGDAHALTDLVAAPASTLTLDLGDGTTKTIDSGTGSLKDVIDGLNGLKDATGKALVNASAVSVGNGQYQLLVTTNATGERSPMTLAGGGLNLGTATSLAGTSAKIDIGAGIVATSTTNTFTDLLPGVSVTVAAGTAADATSEIAVTDDASNRATGVQAFIAQINAVIDSISTATGMPTYSDGEASGGGVLPGDSMVRDFATQLLNTVYTSTGGVLNDVGVSIDRYGHFTFDAATFSEAYSKNPAAVQEAIAGTGGFAKRVLNVANGISGTVGLQSDGSILSRDGSLVQMLSAESKSIDSYNDQIAAWDDRLARKQASLQVIYTALEVNLSKLNAQQSWLSAQLDSLPSNSTKS